MATLRFLRLMRVPLYPRVVSLHSTRENPHSTSKFDHSRDITLRLHACAGNIPHALFPQPLSFHIHTNPPGVSPTPRSLLLACSASSILSPVQSPLSDGTRPKSFIIRSYEKCTCNPFRIRCYKNTGVA